ncbi:MAG: hypothetical protein JXA93_09030 [Anaerolineae bacterium]|nr:hypothetical protein [Anaerolineae bacterium]
MKERRRNLWKGRLAICVVIVSVLLLATSLISLAQERAGTSLDPDDVNAPDEIYEVGTEWIAYFTECPANDIACEEPQCMGFYDELVGAGWGGNDSFHWGNCNAWAEDFKRSAAGGNENNWIDDVDIALFCDHGTSAWDSFWEKNLSALHFGCQDPDGDCNVTPGEAYLSYGDNDLEWLAFKACSVLSDGGPAPYYNRGYWAATMDNLHLLLGFKNSSFCRDNFGEEWAENMLGWKFLGWWIIPPMRVAGSWFEAVDDTQPGGVCARVLAEESYFFNDYLWGRGIVYPDYQDGDYTYWDHCSCTPPPVQLGEEALAQILTLPIVEVVPRQVTENYALGIGAAFGMADSGVYSDTEYFFMTSSSGPYTFTLQVDKTTGSYKYRNATEMWATPAETPTLPINQMAWRIGDSFFADAGANLPAASYRTGGRLIAYEEQVEALEFTPDAAVQAEVELSRMPVQVAMSYGRMLEVTAGTAPGMLPLTLSMVGPGARTKMYLGDGGQIFGVQGGSRDVIETEVHVAIMTADQAWDMFLADPNIALLPPPFVFDNVVRHEEEDTLSYYELPYTQKQTQLVPTWVFSTTFYSQGVVEADGVSMYVPAAAEYLPPEVNIVTPAGGEAFSPGEPVTLSGEVVQHGMAPFTYEWYSSYQGFLGSGETLEVPLWAAIVKGDLTQHTITLHVTDANGQEGSDAVEVSVNASIYLPLVVKSP